VIALIVDSDKERAQLTMEDLLLSENFDDAIVMNDMPDLWRHILYKGVSTIGKIILEAKFAPETIRQLKLTGSFWEDKIVVLGNS